MKTSILFFFLFLLSITEQAQDWPSWSGPNYDWNSDTGQVSIPDHFDAIRLVWRSEENTHEMRAQAQRYGCGNLSKDFSSGGSSPIIYKDNVYFFYNEPSGPWFDTAFVRQSIKDCDSVILEQWKFVCDEIILCIDKNTGKTKWKTTFPRQGYYWDDQTKNLPSNQTCVAANGKIFAYGTSGRVYCVDADNGNILWQNTCGGRFTTLWNLRQAAINNFVNSDGANSTKRTHGGAAFFVDSTFIANIAGAFYAFDEKTGVFKWTKGSVYKQGNPQCWTYNNKKYIITASEGTMKCIDPVNGSELWTYNKVGFNKQGVTVYQNYVLCDTGTVTLYGDSYLTCLQLTPTGPVRLWTKYISRGNFTSVPLVINGYAYVRYSYETKNFKCLDITNGNTVAEISVPNINTSGFACEYDGKIILQPDGNHDDNPTQFMIRPYPDFRILDSWNPDHLNECSYEVPTSYPISDGKWYMRGKYGIWCYDLTSNSSNISINITSPTENTLMLEGDSTTITASATTTSGSIDLVEFYANNHKLGESTSLPYQIKIAVPDTTVAISAIATTNMAEHKQSSPVLLKGRRYAGIVIKPRMKYWLSPLAIYDSNYINLYYGEILKFNAYALDQNGQVLKGLTPTIIWSVTGGGVIDGTGKITANQGTGTFEVHAQGTLNGIQQDTSIVLQIFKRPQKISFDAIANRYITDPPLVLHATSSSGLPVSLSIISGPGILSGDTLKTSGTGTVIIRASQAGNVAYDSAVYVEQSVLIKDFPVLDSISLSPKNSYIPVSGVTVYSATAYDQHGDPMPLQPKFNFTTTGGGTIDSSGIFLADTVKGTYKIIVSATIDSITKADTAIIQVTKMYRAISINFARTANADAYLLAGDAAGVIPMNNWNNQTGSTLNNLKDNTGAVTTASMKLTSTWSAEVCDGSLQSTNHKMWRTIRGYYSSSGAFTITGLPTEFANGQYDVYVYTGSYNGNNTSIRRIRIGGDSLFVKDYGCSLNPFNGTFTESSATTSATASYGTHVVFRGLSGDSLSIISSYVIGIQLLTEIKNYTKQNQTITFNLTDQYYQGYSSDVNLNATASSNLQVYYSVISGPASVSGSTLTLKDTGTLVIKAWQPGSENFNAAVPVIKTIKILPKKEQTISWTLIPDTILVTSLPHAMNFNATSSSGLAVQYLLVNGLSSTISGNTLNIYDEDYLTIRAVQPGNLVYKSAPPIEQSFDVLLNIITSEQSSKIELPEYIVYPNPTSGILTLKLKNNQNTTIKNPTIVVFNITGEIISIKPIYNGLDETIINLSGYPDGLYFIRIDEKVIKVMKLSYFI